MLEASVMAQFDHPNVVKMEGVITKSIYLWICFSSSWRMYTRAIDKL